MEAQDAAEKHTGGFPLKGLYWVSDTQWTLKLRLFRRSKPATFHLWGKKGKHSRKNCSLKQMSALSLLYIPQKKILSICLKWLNSEGKRSFQSGSVFQSTHHQSSGTWALLTPPSDYGSWGIWASCRHRSSARVTTHDQLSCCRQCTQAKNALAICIAGMVTNITCTEAKLLYAWRVNAILRLFLS